MSNIYDKINYKLIKLNPIITDGKPGQLTDLDINKICNDNNIHFNISKCFYITDLNSSLSRGNHSNTNASEILVCLKGSFDIKLHNGIHSETINIKENDFLYIDKNIWVEFYNFVNCIILAFVCVYPDDKCSCYNFDDFLKNINK